MDVERVLMHLDVDCFYCQVEERRDRSLCGKPVGVTQKNLVVTCNYQARQYGVTKLMRISDAKTKCPQLLLRCAEDLTPYRQYAARIGVILQRFGPLERLGLDEVVVDVTDRAKLALDLGSQVAVGTVHRCTDQLQKRCLNGTVELSAPEQQCLPQGDALDYAGGALLAMGSVVAHEARRAVLAETGLTMSAGIAHNKLLAKLCCGLRKPNQQSILAAPDAAVFLAPLPARAIPGIGHKAEAALLGRKVHTVQQLRTVPYPELVQLLGSSKSASWVAAAVFGRDSRPVIPKEPPRAISCEDSFVGCSSMAAVQRVLSVLAPDLIARIAQDAQQHGRLPARLNVKWRHSGGGYHATRDSGSILVEQSPWTAADIQQQSMRLLSQQLKAPFSLSLICLSASSFSDSDNDSLYATVAASVHQSPAVKGTTTSTVDPPPCSSQQHSDRRNYDSMNDSCQLLSKSDERLRREGVELHSAACDEDDTRMDDEDDEEEDFWHDLETVRSGRSAKKPANRTPGQFSSNKVPKPTEVSAVPQLDAQVSQRVVVHLDVDSFYCSVERMDDNSLMGKPLVVSQFNSGGFVAVSYEAKARGIQKGDGVGQRGIDNIQRLQQIGAVPMQEALRRCPQLQVRPMRMDRYRQVSEQIEHVLSECSPNSTVERASCDDFYIDVTQQVRCEVLPECPDQSPAIHMLSEDPVDSELHNAARLAQLMCITVKDKLGCGITLSGGVGRNKLVSYAASSLHKPDGISCVPDRYATQLIHSLPIVAIPGFKGQRGQKVCSQLGVESVADLVPLHSHDICRSLGASTAQMLQQLVLAQCNEPVQERGSPKSVLVERSFPPTDCESTIEAVLREMVPVLLRRAMSTKRPVNKLSFLWRQGYGQQQSLKTRSVQLPQAAAHMLQSKDPETAAPIIVAAALQLLQEHVTKPYQLTRMAVSLALSVGAAHGQPSIARFVQPLSQMPLSSEQVSATGEHNLESSEKSDGFWCPKCSVRIQSTEEQHRDFHFALELQQEINPASCPTSHTPSRQCQQVPGHEVTKPLKPRVNKRQRNLVNGTRSIQDFFHKRKS